MSDGLPPRPPMPAATVGRRPLCQRCGRPQRACLCAWIRATDNRVPLLVLQHPLEAHQAKGSARLLRLSLSDCRCEVGEQFDPEALASWLGDGAVLLYPHETAAPAMANDQPAHAGAQVAPAPQRLVLLDGTWRKTRKMLRHNPLLHELPRHALCNPLPSLYRMRKAQRAEQRSTLEAACLALGEIESRDAHYAPLLQAFDGWVRSHGDSRPGCRARSDQGSRLASGQQDRVPHG